MPFEIIQPGTNYDFIGKWRIAAIVSASIIAAGVVGVLTLGLRFGIDFAGGTEAQVRFEDPSGVDEGRIRDTVEGLDIANPSVVRFGEGTGEFLIKFQGERQIQAEAIPGQTAGAPAAGEVNEKTDRIAALQKALETEIGPIEVQRTEYVGPKVGAELRNDGLQALGLACILILIYIAFRFSARFAPGAIVALVHDVLITSSIWVVLGLEFDLRVLAALLAIIGYSLNDTIIVYDRIRENMELHTTAQLQDVLNKSVNQTLSRTLLTSLTTLAAVGALLLLGGSVVRPFALAMAIGVLIGTYSSVFIAAPTLMWLEQRFGGTSAQKTPAKPKPNRGAVV